MSYLTALLLGLVALLLVVASATPNVQTPASSVVPTVVVRVPTVQARAAVPTPIPVNTDRFAGLLDVARSWLGVRYQWGGCSRSGVDCSCFVRNVLATAGINAPRTTTQQVRWTTPVSREQMQPFDLVYFNDTCTDCGPNPTHVGLYIGGGQMIHAGDPVQVAPVNWSHFASAGRVPL